MEMMPENLLNQLFVWWTLSNAWKFKKANIRGKFVYLNSEIKLAHWLTI